MTRRGTLAVLLALAATGLAPTPAHALQVGMGDQKEEIFADPAFQALGLRHVRVVAPWDIGMPGGPGQRELDAWLAGARRLGQTPLIAFGVSPAWPRGYLPTPAQYRRAFEAFRARWPWVDVFTPWNEANFESQPTARDPRAAATFYNIVRAACAGCRVTAADVLDQDNMADWLREFRRYVDGSPRLWGLHNYHETNRPGWPARTTELLSLVPGEVWVTETGGLVRIVTAAGRVTWPYNERRAAEATARTFALARSSPRITRLYLYHWSASPGATWDSGFVGPLGQPRLALQVLRDELARLATTATRKRARARCPRGMRARTRKGTRRCVCVRASRQSAKRSRRCRRASTRRSR